MRYLMLYCLLAGGLTLNAQEFQFGIGMSVASSEISAPDLSSEQLSVLGIDPKLESGVSFGINIYSRWLINDWLSLSSAPGIIFQDNRLQYLNTAGEEIEEDLYPVGVSLPVALELNPGHGQWRPHFSAGVGVFINLADKENPPALSLRKNLLFGQLSAGLSCETSKFTVRPELVFWHNLINLIEDGVNTEAPDTDWKYIGFRVLFYGNRNI